MDEKDLIRQLVKALDLDELTQGYRRRLLIFDSQIEGLRNLEKEYRQRLTDMDEAITNLKALYQINMRVLNIVNAPEKAGAKDETNFATRFTQ